MCSFKRQNVLVHVTPEDVAAGVAPGHREPIIMSLANAPGLPPVCAVVLVCSDEDEAVVRAPEGFELIQVPLRVERAWRGGGRERERGMRGMWGPCSFLDARGVPVVCFGCRRAIRCCLLLPGSLARSPTLPTF
jgi:hypothetical protein